MTETETLATPAQKLVFLTSFKEDKLGETEMFDISKLQPPFKLLAQWMMRNHVDGCYVSIHSNNGVD